MRRSISTSVKGAEAAPPTGPREADRATVVLAIARSREGRHADAIRLLSEVAARRPMDASVHADLAMALLQAGRLEEALRGFSQALRLDPRSAQAQCGLGLAYQRLDRWQEAAEAFRVTETLAPDQPVAPLNLGLALHALGEREAARQALLRAAALAPDDQEIREALSALAAERSAAEPPSLARFTGDLGTFGLPEVLELMRVQRKTGALVISSPQGAGIVRLVQGRLTSASAPGGQHAGGRPAPEGGRPEAVLRQLLEELAQMVSWREGAFSFHPSGATEVPAVSFDTQRVVMELFRVAEERRGSRRSSP